MEPIIRADNISKKYSFHGVRTRLLREVISDLFTFRKGAPSAGEPGAANDAPQDFWALRSATFDIFPGEVVGIIGKNGSGKSTLLKILSKIVEPTEGSIQLRGRVGSILEVGTGFHQELTGRENVYLNGIILGMSTAEINRKFESIVEFSGVSQFLDTPVKHYSSGMYVRLAFAVAAHLDAEILLIDEVLAVGDLQFQKKCMDKIRELTREGRTILLVSHDTAAITALCTRGILLDSGAVVPTQTLDECIRLYSGIHTESAKAEWCGDTGDDNLRLYRATIESEPSGRNYFCRGEQFLLRMEYEVLRESPDIVVGTDVLNRFGRFLCATIFTQIARGDTLAEVQRRGKHAVTLKIDTSIFTDGFYFIEPNFGLYNVKRIVENEPLLAFMVTDTTKNKLQNSPLYSDIVYPAWQWRVEER